MVRLRLNQCLRARIDISRKAARYGWNTAMIRQMRCARHCLRRVLRGYAQRATWRGLREEAIRQVVKAFAIWPTIPQLYVDAAFIGVVDIMAEMAHSSELQQLFSDLFKNIN